VLQRRYDLIPNLVETVKGYAKHEQTIYGDISKALQSFSRATTIRSYGSRRPGTASYDGCWSTARTIFSGHRWGLALAQRGGKNAKKRAKVAVARKLGVLMHRLWVTGEVYEPLGYHERQLAGKAAA